MPSARRKSISRRRDAARASRRFATFAQLMRSTRTTAARSSSSGCANRPRSLETPWPAGVSLNVDSLISRRTSADMRGTKNAFEHPAKRHRQPRFGLRNGDARLQPADNARAMTCPGCSASCGPGTIDAHIVSGTHKSGDAPTSSPKNPAGATPTIVDGHAPDTHNSSDDGRIARPDGAANMRGSRRRSPAHLPDVHLRLERAPHRRGHAKRREVRCRHQRHAGLLGHAAVNRCVQLLYPAAGQHIRKEIGLLRKA